MTRNFIYKTIMHVSRILRFPLGLLFNCPPVLFLHLQKTAGSAMIGLLKIYYRNSFIMYNEYADKRPEQLQHTSLIAGHFGYDYAHHLMSSRYSFTFLRHPGERILSLYYYCRTRDPDEYPINKLAHDSTLEEFLEAGLMPGIVKDRIWNHQAWQLAHGWGSLTGKTLEDFSPDEILPLATKHLLEFSYVGLTETFDEDCQKILGSLNIPPLEEMYIVNKTTSRLCIKDISPTALELLDQLTRLDQKLYETALQLRAV